MDFIGWAIGGAGVLVGVVGIFLTIHFYKAEDHVLQRVITKLGA